MSRLMFAAFASVLVFGGVAEAETKSRRLWVDTNGGYFIQGAGTDWIEVWPRGEETHLYTEVARTDEYIEIRYKTRDLRYRLYDGRMQQKEAGVPEFQWRNRGQWAAEPIHVGKPIHFPEKIRKAWTDAGAMAGWMMARDPGYFGFMKDEKRAKSNDMPAFSIHRVKPEVLATLPDPGIPFGLRLNFADFTDANVKDLVSFKSLTVLSLSSTKITGAAFKPLAELTNLEFLYLSYNERITGAGLGELAGLKKLRLLDLGVTSMNDAGMKELAKLEHLTSLSLYSTGATDAGMKELSGMKGLTWLNLNSTHFGDAAMKIVAQNKDLKTLDLFSGKISDAGVKELAGLQKLEKLTLSNAKLSDACLGDLASIKSLSYLELSSTGVTYAGILRNAKSFQGLMLLGVNAPRPSNVSIEDLKKALPRCIINY